MESLGYEKSGRIMLIGFIAFSLVVIWLLNVYSFKERTYKQETVDVQMSKEILLESKHLDELLVSMHQNLFIQKEWLKKILGDETASVGIDLFSALVYFPEDDVCILDDTLFGSSKEIGNIILNGDKEIVHEDAEYEINKLGDFFQFENILNSQLTFEMNTIYYSKNQYVTYYPYLHLGDKNVDFNAVFSSVDSLIGKIQTLDKEDPNFDIEQGWDRVSLDDTTAKNLTFTTAMPIVTKGDINGILTGSINETEFSDVFSNTNTKADYYLIDENQTIIYTNNHNIEDLSPLTDAFTATYKNLKYYINKFPTELETRYEKNYTLYITNLDKNGWQLIYVVDKKNALVTTRLVIINLLLVIVVLGFVYYTLRYSNKKQHKLESIIQTSSQDSMTELLNHKSIIEALRKYIRNRRIKRIAVMMLDLDDFKKVNDGFGHGVGDDVIKICSCVIKQSLEGKNAVCGRYGGEEFMAVLYGIEASEAIEIADGIRTLFQSSMVEKMGLDVTMSIGLIHVIRPFEMNAEALINEADKNLYKAKKSGKNRVQN